MKTYLFRDRDGELTRAGFWSVVEALEFAETFWLEYLGEAI